MRLSQQSYPRHVRWHIRSPLKKMIVNRLSTHGVQRKAEQWWKWDGVRIWNGKILIYARGPPPSAHGPSSSRARAERRDYIRSPTRGRDLGNPSAYNVGKFRRFPVIKMPVVAAHLYGENMIVWEEWQRWNSIGSFEYAWKVFRVRYSKSFGKSVVLYFWRGFFVIYFCGRWTVGV